MVMIFSSVEHDQPDDPGDFRLRQFPARAVGKIDFYSPDRSCVITSDSSGAVAQGEVKFPNGMKAMMDIFPDACGDLSGLAALEADDLSRISFYDCQLEDFQLKHLQHLTGLSCLDLKGTNVSEFGLFFLQSLTGLHTLILDATPTNDEGLRYLPTTNLWNLYLKRTQISDDGIHIIKEAPALRCLHLPATITDKGIENLAGSGVVSLDLSDCTKLTANCFAHLKQLVQLTEVDLPDQITDADLEQLSQLNIKLQTIGFSPQSSTTKEAREQLQANGIADRIMVANRC